MQVSTKGEDPESSFAQHTNLAAGTTEYHAFIEELDDEKDGTEDTAASEISNESTQVCSQSDTHLQRAKQAFWLRRFQPAKSNQRAPMLDRSELRPGSETG